MIYNIQGVPVKSVKHKPTGEVRIIKAYRFNPEIHEEISVKEETLVKADMDKDQTEENAKKSKRGRKPKKEEE